MNNKGYTKIADVLLDTWLSDLSEAELKTLLVIIRQTIGWNKARDRISHGQFKKKTGLSGRSITRAIESLSDRNFIIITNNTGQALNAQERRYQTEIYYQCSDFTKAHASTIIDKLDQPPMPNLPITIYNTHTQQYTRISSSQNNPKIKKQTDSERVECIRKQKLGLFCSCFRCS